MTDIHTLLENEEQSASAPCRIDVGGTLDLSTFFLPMHHLGPCTFNAALNLRTRVKLSPYIRGKVKISSRGFDEVEVDGLTAPFAHPLGLIMAVAAYFNADGVHIQIDSASPPRSALGGSSVAAVALVWAFAKVLSREGRPMPSRDEAALLAHAIEQSVAGVPCGMQDQLAAAYGGVNGWYWHGPHRHPGFERKVLKAPDELKVFSKHLLVAYCGAPHQSVNINGAWVQAFLKGRHRDQWRRMLHCSRQFIDAMANGDIDQAQALMNEEAQIRIQMTPGVLDEVGHLLVQEARDFHCGARFAGAGGGGCVWALGTPGQIQTLRVVWDRVASRYDGAFILDTDVDPNGVL